MKTFLYGAMAIGIALASAPAWAALDDATKKQAIDTCQNGDPDLQVAITACTTILDNVQVGPQTKAAFLYFRGTYYSDIGQADQAIADFTQAIGIYDGAADKAKWAENIVGMMGSSYSWRAKDREKLKQCDDAKADFKKAAEMSTEISERRKYEAAARNVCKS